MGNRIGVCSWSLRPGDPAELARAVSELELGALQLALDPLRRGEWNLAEVGEELERHALTIASGMMEAHGEDYSTLESIRKTGGFVPDEHWERNLEAATANARLARELDLDLVSLHAGFLPEDEGPERTKLIERLRAIAQRFSDHGVRIALETGQEDAQTLALFLEELNEKSIGVNFDPANMILYDKGDPVLALDQLAPHVFQVHIKDATKTKQPGTWGAEVPAGTGEVDWSAFFACLRRHNLDVDLMIEREAGEERLKDILTARKLVEGELSKKKETE